MNSCLLTAGVDINAEGGEFLEIIKMDDIFKEKPLNDANKEHLIIELGDLCGMLHSNAKTWCFF